MCGATIRASSSALELGELACRALRDASTEANASSVLEGLLDGPHAVELVRKDAGRSYSRRCGRRAGTDGGACTTTY